MVKDLRVRLKHLKGPALLAYHVHGTVMNIFVRAQLCHLENNIMERGFLRMSMESYARSEAIF